MPHIDIPVQPARRYYTCACGEKLKYTGSALLSNPPRYVHACEKCFTESYTDSITGDVVFINEPNADGHRAEGENQ